MGYLASTNLEQLPALGTLTYSLGAGQTFTFNSSVETTNFEATPVFDESGRTVAYTNFDCTFRCVVDGDDASINEAVSILQKPAGTLIISDRAQGSWPVNLLNFRDVKWGPKPMSVRLVKDVGSNKLTYLTWRVQFALMTCDDALSTGIMERGITLNFKEDHSGYTTRTMTGYARIAQTRRTPLSRQLIDSIDNYREELTPPLLVGFRRDQNWTLSQDKCRIDYTITDEQLGPNAFPRGIVEADASHSYSTIGTPGGARWMFNLEAQYELMQGFTTDNAIWAFLAMMKDRLDDARNMVQGAGLAGVGFPLAPGGPVLGDKVWPIPWAFSVSEPTIFGRTKAKFNASYMIAGCGLSEILRTGGLWNAVPNLAGTADASHADWNNQVTHGYAGGLPLMGSRGFLGLKFQISDENITDLCGTVPPVETITPPTTYVRTTPGPGPGTPGGTTPPPGSSPTYPYPPSQSPYNQQLQQAVPPPNANQSWLWFQNTPVIRPVDMGVLVGKTLPTSPLSPSQQTSQSQQSWGVMSGVNGVASGVNATPFPPADRVSSQSPGDTFVQQRTTPTVLVTIEGGAARAGWSIPCPELVQYAGLKPIYIGGPDDYFGQSIVRNCGIPIVQAGWRLTYLLTGVGTGQAPVTSNPYLS